MGPNPANPKSLLIKIAVGVAVILIFALWPFGGSGQNGSGVGPTRRPGARRYGIMMDAGSTGSRIHVFEFETATDGSMTLLGELFEEVKPGLSAYADSPQEAANSLKPLLDAAVAKVPLEQQASTPIELKATAGLRLIGEAKSEAILTAVYKFFKRHPFKVSGPQAAIVMDGKDEGPYAWMTVNFLLGNLKGANPQTAAIVDMGGASTQIVFQPDSASDIGKIAAEQTYEVKTAHFRGAVYTHSHLGYGLKQAEMKMFNQHMQDRGTDKPFPCFPKGYTKKHAENSIVNFDDSAQNFKQCLSTAAAILNKNTVCKSMFSTCSFNGVAQPLLAKAFSGPMYVFSYYYDRMEPFLGEDGISSVGGLKAVAEGVCSSSSKVYTEHNKGEMCMDLTYLYALLSIGYDLPETKTLYVKKKINGIETAWALGAMMVAMN